MTSLTIRWFLITLCLTYSFVVLVVDEFTVVIMRQLRFK